MTDGYECAGCGYTYQSVLAAAQCCEGFDDLPPFTRNYELGKN